jgi:hypothetical protein
MKYQKPAKVTYRWTHEVPLVVRAMVLAGDVLFAAGPPMTAAGTSDEPTFDAQGPAVLMAFSAADGEQLSRRELRAQPVFDAMAAAGGRLYLSTVDGRVTCLAGTE